MPPPISGAVKRISAGSRTNVWGSMLVATSIVTPMVTATLGPNPRRPRGAGADGTVWGVDANGDIYRYTGDQGDPTHWVQIPGLNFIAISAGTETNVWGVTSKGDIYTFAGDDGQPWVQIGGRLSSISAGADGVVWGVATGGI
ncbi:hypothetical protein C8J57DRAFT_1240300 [Mycena rebaudengoi]|nr:hypothetical protein C8J57DRAFT_1240300 [Mycena rebaudengoi]